MIIHSFIHSFIFTSFITLLVDSNMNMWTNAYNTYGNALQRDQQPSSWLNQNVSSGFNSKSSANRQNGFNGDHFTNFLFRSVCPTFRQLPEWCNKSIRRWTNVRSGVSTIQWLRQHFRPAVPRVVITAVQSSQRS